MKFRMVDRILSWQPQRSIRGVKAVSFEEYGLKDAMGDRPRLPESLVLESLLQLGNWLIVLSSDYRQMGWVTEIEEARFDGPLGPGERLVMEVSVREQDEEGLVLQGSGHSGGRRVAAVTGWRVRRQALAPWCSEADLRMLFSEIHRPASGEAI